MGERTYIAIDLKSFYASVECRERGLDPMTTHLVVADRSRTEKTICLAVSPSLKAACGIPGRPRLFEVVEKVKAYNALRRDRAPGHLFSGSSFLAAELARRPELELEYLVAPPRMARYMAVSTQVYQVYLRFVAPEDIHVYSIDEVFLDVTNYLPTYGLTPRELAAKMIRAVLAETGITATAGIGPNLYLCKVAMDIVAKHVPPDADGVRIAQLDEMDYRRQLWDHRPLTDFWRLGPGYAKKLEANGLMTMGDVARCSIGTANEFYNEDLLYRLFGVNAELLIDHAWGWEPCGIADIKAYRPQSRSVGAGQVLTCPYTFQKARVVVREMADLLALDLVDKGLLTAQLTLTVGYDAESLKDPAGYRGAVTTDRYGRRVPRHAHGTTHLKGPTSSTREIVSAMLALYDRVTDPVLLVRRLNISADRVCPETGRESRETAGEQLDLFTAPEDRGAEKARRERERRRQEAILMVKRRYGKNAILTGASFEEGATTRERNRQIGGHRA